MSPSTPPDALVLFDGVCNLCNGSVQWILAHDRAQRFRFAALQSNAARAALSAANAPSELPDSVVLVADGRVFLRSDAAIGIARRLGFPWSLAAVALVLPRFVRDGIYGWIARNRYRWFGKKDACMVPTKALRARFLDADERRTAPPA